MANFHVDLNGNGIKDYCSPAQAHGDYTWMVTVPPTSAEARDALATDPSAFKYEVSVVVFYKRPLTSVTPTSQTEVDSKSD